MRACNRRLVAATLTAAMLLAMSPAYAAEPDEETLSEQQTVATEATVSSERDGRRRGGLYHMAECCPD